MSSADEKRVEQLKEQMGEKPPSKKKSSRALTQRKEVSSAISKETMESSLKGQELAMAQVFAQKGKQQAQMVEVVRQRAFTEAYLEMSTQATENLCYGILEIANQSQNEVIEKFLPAQSEIPLLEGIPDEGKNYTGLALFG